MEKIAIIGAGWLGLPLGASLAAEGHVVFGTTTRKEKLPIMEEVGLKPQLWNFSKSPVEELGFLAETDVLILTLPPDITRTSFVLKLRKVIAAVKEVGICKVLYISSTSVYPAVNREMFEEEVVVSSRDDWDDGPIVEKEEVIRSEPSLSPTIIRFGGLFGPGRHPGEWMGGRKEVPGADSPVNFIHLTDCIGVIKEVIRQGVWGETFNAVAPEHPSKKDFYDRACADLGLILPTWGKKPAPWKKVNSDKIIKRLGYTFVYSNPISAY
ncbi:MAG TPA: hypothetical protein ENJ82_11300 [Bacteroidetes bacterium]|nr:hypothetical protein [Bacteroidota bacterium]